MGKTRILVISDIHGNKEALQQVDKFIKRTKVDKIICLGDVVGYGVDFKWCLEWIVEHNAVLIKGNHESMILGETSIERCSDIAKQSFKWTYEQVDKKIEEKLKACENLYVYENILFTHAGNIDILKWRYIENIDRARECFSNEYKINFFGHTHRACIIDESGTKVDLTNTTTFRLSSEKCYYINPGSVGQNRGTKTRVSFMIIESDMENITLKYYSRRYKSYKAYRKILSSSMASEIGTYLVREETKRKLYDIVYKLVTTIKK